jgi:hypothetical protein
MPFIFMEAMSSKRLYGGGRADFIPGKFKPKVYQQISNFVLQLYNIPFSTIGMLHANEGSPFHVKVGQIYDQHYRMSPYGPFTDSLEFYHSRWLLLNKHYGAVESDTLILISDVEMPAALCHLVDQRSVAGPFYLAHPDYQISNFLFNDEYTITALLD